MDRQERIDRMEEYLKKSKEGLKMKVRYTKIENYLKDRIVKKHCLNVLKRYLRITQNFNNIDEKMKRILNKTLSNYWQSKYNNQDTFKNYLCDKCLNVL